MRKFWGCYNCPAAAGTSWSNVPTDFTLTGLGFQGSDFSTGETITLSNGSGNTTIQCSQAGLNGVLSVAASTSSTDKRKLLLW